MVASSEIYKKQGTAFGRPLLWLRAISSLVWYRRRVAE